jgi:hypothetical protein
MATLTVVDVVANGVADALAAVTSSDAFPNTGAEFLDVLNGSGSSINVTFPIAQLVDGQAVASRVVAVAAGVRKKIGPFPPNVYNNTLGQVTVNYSATTTVTAQVQRLTKNAGP